MTTIGYGDFTPKTLSMFYYDFNFKNICFIIKAEKSFILILSVLACGVFAYTFS